MKRFLHYIAIVALATSCDMAMDNSYDGGFIYPEHDGEPSDKEDPQFTEYGENNFISAEQTPLSSFSVDADGASYAVMRSFITNELTLPSAAVRIEEFLNYFTFDYPEPEAGHTLSVNSEITKAPWNDEHYLLRLGLKGKTIAKEALPPSNYVFLVDVSGSMSSYNKLDLLKDGLIMLTNNLRDDDRVSIVTYSGRVSLDLEPTLGRDKNQIIEAISQLEASGSTNGGDAIKMAYETAMEYYVECGNNRVVLATDGDFNVGVTDTDELVELIESYLDSGVYLTTLGFGSDFFNDSMMEQVANHGNGNYEYIDCVAQMKKVFVDEISKLYCVAKDSKIQVEFNPAMVNRYRLIGYENRVMSEEEFDDEKKDAGEVGVGQTITALYEIIPVGVDWEEEGETPGSGGYYTSSTTPSASHIAKMTLRYKGAEDEVSHEIVHSVDGDYKEFASNIPTANQNFASSVALFGMILKESKFKGEGDKSMVVELANSSLSFDPNGYRSEFVNLVKATY